MKNDIKKRCPIRNSSEKEQHRKMTVPGGLHLQERPEGTCHNFSRRNDHQKRAEIRKLAFGRLVSLRLQK